MKKFALALVIFMAVAAAAAADAATEAELKSLLKARTSGNVLAFNCFDYDADGKNEAFAFVGEETSDSYYGSYSGEFWFVNEKGAQMLSEKRDYWEINDVLSFGSHKFVLLTEWFGVTESISRIWGVRNGAPHDENISGYTGAVQRVDEKNLTMTDSTYDGMTDGTGHTWKKYFFYWDENESTFHEYGGMTISVDQLLKRAGAKKIIDSIKAAGGSVGKIFYRANNLVNINYLVKDSNNNVTLLLENNSVKILSPDTWSETDLNNSNQGGVYEAAMIPNIATYPKKFPVEE